MFFIVGYIFEQLTFSVLLLLFYLPLRISLGGYHCKKALNCFCFFTFILIILNFFEQNRFEKIIFIIDIILIVFYFFHQKELTKKMIGNVILIGYFYYLISFQNNSLIYAIFLCLGLYFLQLMSDWHNKFSKDSIQWKWSILTPLFLCTTQDIRLGDETPSTIEDLYYQPFVIDTMSIVRREWEIVGGKILVQGMQIILGISLLENIS